MRVNLLGLWGVLSLLAGCSSEPVAEQRGEGVEAILLEDRFADGGVFKVVKHDGGRVGLSVSAPIGSEAQKLAEAASAEAQVASIYAALHPELADIGEEVRAISALVELSRAEAGASVPSELREKREAEAELEADVPAAVDKSAAAFVSNCCKTISNGTWKKVTRECLEPIRTKARATGYNLDSDGTLADRSYVWNETELSAPHIACNSGVGWNCLTWRPSVEAFTWTWREWGGVYQDYSAIFHVDAAADGYTLPAHLAGVGITSHRASYIVK